MLENDQQNQDDPQNKLLNLDSGIEIPKALARRSSYYDKEIFVEPWDQQQDNFLQLTPKLQNLPQQDRKVRQIKIKLPQSRTQSRQKSNETQQTQQTVQITLPVHDRAGSCHSQFQDLGFQTQTSGYKNIIEKMLCAQPTKIVANINNYKQIGLKLSTNKKKVKQIVQVKQKQPFSWSDYYKFIQKNHNSLRTAKIFTPNCTGYQIAVNKSMQQKIDREQFFKNFRLKSNQTKTIA